MCGLSTVLQELLNQIQSGELSDRQGSCNHDSLKVLVEQTCQLEFDMMQAVTLTLTLI